MLVTESKILILGMKGIPTEWRPTEADRIQRRAHCLKGAKFPVSKRESNVEAVRVRCQRT